MAYSEPKVTIDLAHYNELVDKCNKEFEKPAEKNKFKDALEAVARFVDVELSNVPLRGRPIFASQYFEEILRDYGIELVFTKNSNGLELIAK